MYGESNPSQAEFDSAMQTLRGLGVATAVIEFSGGNDEGGTDGIDYFDVEGDNIDVGRSNAYENIYYTNGGRRNDGWSVYDPSLGGTWDTQKRPATPEEIELAKIAKVMEYPIYDRWGTFAGEFYVHGTLTWDVASGTHTLHGQESSEVWEDF